MQQGKVVSLILKEVLKISYEGSIYTIETSVEDELFRGLTLSRDELSQVRKLPCDLRAVLLAKILLRAQVDDVDANAQTTLGF